MRTLLPWLAACAVHPSPFPGETCPYEDTALAIDAPGPHGFSARELAALLPTGSYEVVADPSYGPEWSMALAAHGPFAFRSTLADERPFVRTYDADPCGPGLLAPALLFAVVDVHLTSHDAAFDVAGRSLVLATALDPAQARWERHPEDLGLTGAVPDWVDDAARARQAALCPSGPEAPDVRALVAGTLSDARMSVNAGFQEVGVCQYTALLAVGGLQAVP